MKKRTEILEIFLDIKNIILYIYTCTVDLNTNVSVFAGYTVYDNTYKLYNMTKNRMDKITLSLRERGHIIEVCGVDTYYFQQGGAIRLFTSFGKKEYYIFLNTNHKYTSPLYKINLVTLLNVRQELALLSKKDIYLSRSLQFPKIKSITTFLEHFIGKK